MFKDFVPMQLACLRKYTELIPGTAETVNTLRSEFGVKIGSTTGFLKNMVDILLEDAKKQGYQPDSSVAGRLKFAAYKSLLKFVNTCISQINNVGYKCINVVLSFLHIKRKKTDSFEVLFFLFVCFLISSSFFFFTRGVDFS